MKTPIRRPFVRVRSTTMPENVELHPELVPHRQNSRGSFHHDLLVGLFSGFTVAILSVLVQVHFDDVRSDREARQENLRYVRDRSSDQIVDRPFQGIDLRGENLNGLKLEKADLGAADLAKVSANQANLKSAGLSAAKLRNSLLAPWFHRAAVEGRV
ncbi:pentapeptide repeat-containing protein [Arthrobacter sp. CC3]|uniref:pentapeptide repeat-containing protein n=1 Tax=Arthrobacter sp. CC3 TaxID=3029185 RepID=UPI0032672099